MVQNIKNKYPGLFKTIKLWAGAIQQVKDMIIADIAYEKQEWFGKKEVDRVIGIKTSYRK